MTTCWLQHAKPRLAGTSPHYLTTTHQKKVRQLLVQPSTLSPHVIFKNPESHWGVWVSGVWAACSPCLAPANKSFAVNTHCQEFGFLHRRHRSSCQVTVSNFFEEQNWDNRKKDPGPMWRKKKMKGKRKQDVSTLVWTLLWNGESRYQLKWKNKCRGKRRWWTSVPSGKEEGWGGVSGRFQSI